jgi:hypothetical protein
MSFLAPKKFVDGNEWSEKYENLDGDKVLELHEVCGTV